MSREAILDVLVITNGKMDKLPEYGQKASILYTFKKCDGGGEANRHSLPLQKAGTEKNIQVVAKRMCAIVIVNLFRISNF